MGRPKEGYHLKDGAKIPGVTTIVGRFKDSGALIYWAWNQGKEGKDFREARDVAASIGTLAHQMVEAHLRNEILVWEKPLDAETLQKATQAFGMYLAWENQTKLEIIATEMPMVSEAYKFGGTPDAIGSMEGKLCLLDWKTSNGLYPDYLIQMAAYKALWEENNPKDLLTGGFHLLRFSKEVGDFTHHYFSELEGAWQMFTHLRVAYELDRDLKKRAK